jgi:hemicentin
MGGVHPQAPSTSVTADPGWCLADPPHIKDSGQPAELSLTPGAPMELLCDARGVPSPNITWYKDGQALSRPENGSPARQRLQVEAVQVLMPAH